MLHTYINFNTKKDQITDIDALRWFIVSENSPDVRIFSV